MELNVCIIWMPDQQPVRNDVCSTGEPNTPLGGSVGEQLWMRCSGEEKHQPVTDTSQSVINAQCVGRERNPTVIGPDTQSRIRTHPSSAPSVGSSQSGIRVKETRSMQGAQHQCILPEGQTAGTKLTLQIIKG